MTIGLGLLLILVGVVLTQHIVSFDFAFVDEYRLGMLLIVIGAIGLLISLFLYGMNRNGDGPGRVDRY